MATRQQQHPSGRGRLAAMVSPVAVSSSTPASTTKVIYAIRNCTSQLQAFLFQRGGMQTVPGQQLCSQQRSTCVCLQVDPFATKTVYNDGFVDKLFIKLFSQKMAAQLPGESHLACGKPRWE